MIDNERDESKTVISPNGSALGGTTRCTLVTALSFPFPISALAKAGARVFVFGNAGGLGNGIYEDNEIKKVSIFLPKPSMQPIFGIMRASVGTGVVIPIATAARLEFTYSMPFLKLSDDFTKQFQIGVGVTIN
jgi:outer membrane protein assembly factor BamA